MDIVQWQRIQDDSGSDEVADHQQPGQDVAQCPTLWERVASSDEETSAEAASTAIATRYAEHCQHGSLAQARHLDVLDVDGWAMERSQLDLVAELDEDLRELEILLQCCERCENKSRIEKAIADCQVAGAGGLRKEDVHCSFGMDWFDLKIWNVEYPEDPGVKYHHRVRKTKLTRDIIPSQSFVSTRGDHVCVTLQKVFHVRHGYCAWRELTIGNGRKPFQFQEDAHDGGLMDFLEEEYEKHAGYDGFRREIGKAMEQAHSGKPVPGVPDCDDGDWGC